MSKIEEHAGIQIPIYYYEDDNGNRVYDYEEMTNEFENKLSMLNQDVVVMCSVEDKPNRNESVPGCATKPWPGLDNIKHFADGFHEGDWERDIAQNIDESDKDKPMVFDDV